MRIFWFLLIIIGTLKISFTIAFALNNVVEAVKPTKRVTLPLNLVEDHKLLTRGSSIKTEATNMANNMKKSKVDGIVDEETKKMFPEVYSGLFEGDIIVPEMGNRNALLDPNALWPNGMVPYVIEPLAFDPTAMYMIREAMNRIQVRTCIVFVPFSGDGPHVRIGSETPDACYSVIGYQPGHNVINFGGPGCFNYATLQHELLHTLGLHHEHNRVDRDKYLDIDMKNVDNKFKDQFNLPPKDSVTTHNLPYDYQSVMHYPRTAFSLNMKPTMTAKGNFLMELGNREGPTAIDIEKINLMYQCNPILPMDDLKNLNYGNLKLGTFYTFF